MLRQSARRRNRHRPRPFPLVLLNADGGATIFAEYTPLLIARLRLGIPREARRYCPSMTAWIIRPPFGADALRLVRGVYPDMAIVTTRGRAA